MLEDLLCPVEKYREQTFEEFEKIFKSLKPNKAVGQHDFDNNVIIKVNGDVSWPLFMIFHSSFSEDIFQVHLKSTNASSIFKVSNIKEVGNCRPLSVLPIFPKVLERLMYNRTFQYFKKNYMLFPKQRDFELNNSMHHAI